MRVWILCNTGAGRSISDDDLRTLVESAGHAVVDVVSKERDAERPDLARVDLVVAAGGDGTVARGAAVVAGTPTPLAILPLGTANNIAASLGISGEMTDLISSWPRAGRMPFDLGYARADSKTWLLVEGAGCGLVPSGIAAAEKDAADKEEGPAADPAAHPTDEVATAVETFHDVLSTLEPSRYSGSIDGTPFSEELLLFEILNIRSVGPNLMLAADASSSDGRFDVVLAGPSHRRTMLAYLESLMAGRPGTLALPTRHARSVSIDSCSVLHLDDERLDLRQLGRLTIDISPAAVTMLV